MVSIASLIGRCASCVHRFRGWTMADESVFTPQDALEVIRHEAADVLSLYPGKHGGIRPTQAIAHLAEAAGIPCTIGSNLAREVATAAMAPATVATSNLQG